MAHQNKNTFASIVTPPGLGGISVITLHGPAVDKIINTIFVPSVKKNRDGGDLRLGHIVCREESIDEVLLCRRSGRYEINIHGGPVVARKVLEVLSDAGAEIRMATPPCIFKPSHPHWNNPTVGTEMLAMLPEARGPAAVKLLSCQWSAGLSSLARNTLETCEKNKKESAENLRRAARRSTQATSLVRGPEIVIAGPPNTGKSTLANSLTGKEACIVTDIAGTTRDWVRETALVGDVEVWITDTAGIWDPDSHVDTEAVRRAAEKISQADLVILLKSVDSPDDIEKRIPPVKYLRVASKCDLGRPEGQFDVFISVAKPEGLRSLSDAILRSLNIADFNLEQPAAFTDRQVRLLEQAAECLDGDDSEKARTLLKNLLGNEDLSFPVFIE